MGGGTMIGAGIVILPGIAAEGAGPASVLSFAICLGIVGPGVVWYLGYVRRRDVDQSLMGWPSSRPPK